MRCSSSNGSSRRGAPSSKRRNSRRRDFSESPGVRGDASYVEADRAVTQRTVIELKDVKKVYQSRVARREPVLALQNVSFEVKEGEFLALVGPSGCGKSTLLKLVSGLMPPTEGTVKVNGVEVRGPQPDIGIVFQFPVLMEWRRVLDNILLPIEVLERNDLDYRKRALDLVKLVGLTGFEDKYPFELSGGMQQRVSICRALIHDPPGLIMDEPFSALDEMTRDAMNVELQRIWLERRKTVLYITHSINEAVFLSDRVAVMSARPGRILKIIDIPLPRPRSLRVRAQPEFVQQVEAIRDLLGLLE
ncbi:MAG: ABC transporter ATP-binding protein [Candidatus Tectomicrobia bacterium]|nr:ABC transporter ATP-binding protein [Candidatus Tectomicrobia bacterium]